MEEHVVEWLSALARGLHEDVEVLAQPRLPDHLVEGLRAQRLLGAPFLGLPRQGELSSLHAASSRPRIDPSRGSASSPN